MSDSFFLFFLQEPWGIDGTYLFYIVGTAMRVFFSFSLRRRICVKKNVERKNGFDDLITRLAPVHFLTDFVEVVRKSLPTLANNLL